MSKTTTWSVTVALAGFLFGFDTIVISGADKPIQALWNMGPLFHGTFIMSMALWGTVLGSLLGGIPTKRLGRKRPCSGSGSCSLCRPLEVLWPKILIPSPPFDLSVGWV